MPGTCWALGEGKECREPQSCSQGAPILEGKKDLEQVLKIMKGKAMYRGIWFNWVELGQSDKSFLKRLFIYLFLKRLFIYFQHPKNLGALNNYFILLTFCVRKSERAVLAASSPHQIASCMPARRGASSSKGVFTPWVGLSCGGRDPG